MQISELYSVLKSSYTLKNLNELSSGIIQVYRNKDYALLRRIHALIYNGDQAEEERTSRMFSRIIMQYHPDRLEKINADLDEAIAAVDELALEKYRHIIEVERLDFSVSQPEADCAADFEFDDIWDYSMEGFSYIDEEEQENDPFDYVGEVIMNHGFYAAVKRKVYGHLNVEFPVHLLADMEIIEMAEYEIENLDGIEYCTYARIMDLSGNNLTDITMLGQLMRLEEIFLQNNQISYIDSLNNLPFLRVLDLSNNDVDDLSPLFEVESLEFLNIIGNKVPRWQLEKLSLAGVAVVY